MDKGVRVEIVKGRKGKGVVGTVFWIGDDKYKEGAKRVGVHGDDGETYWVSADYVEPSDAPVPEAEGPDPEKGDRVAWSQGEDGGEGEVFWVGPSKAGDGTRLGIRCDDGETRWFDARHVTRLEGDAASVDPSADEAPMSENPAPPGAEVGEEPQWDDEDPPF